MVDKCLIRAYNVEVGDCLYVRLPKARRAADGSIDDFHILVDCGTRGRGSKLKRALKDMKTNVLPTDEGGKKRLDLLVCTHEHQDHIKGFDPEDFRDMSIGAIWMSAAMDPAHPQAEHAHNMTALAATAMRSLSARNLALNEEQHALMEMFSIDNAGAVNALREALPRANGIEPVYVHADMEPDQLRLPLEGATIRILGPERNIDKYYLGDESADLSQALMLAAAQNDGDVEPARRRRRATVPGNISHEDFERLQSRMLSSSFAFAELVSRVQNNSCIVFLIEWQRRRLLFVGDCEWEETYAEGKQNGGWNVMWHGRHRDLLAQPVDFLKIGHHGSINSTPWNPLENGEMTEPAEILDAILPRPEGRRKPKAFAVVSTMRSNTYKTIPDAALLAEIGRRVGSTRNYGRALAAADVDLKSLPRFDEFEKDWIHKKQPLRTDFEQLITEKPYVDVELRGV